MLKFDRSQNLKKFPEKFILQRIIDTKYILISSLLYGHWIIGNNYILTSLTS